MGWNVLVWVKIARELLRDPAEFSGGETVHEIQCMIAGEVE